MIPPQTCSGKEASIDLQRHGALPACLAAFPCHTVAARSRQAHIHIGGDRVENQQNLAEKDAPRSNQWIGASILTCFPSA